jgi:hypothetical protein
VPLYDFEDEFLLGLIHRVGEILWDWQNLRAVRELVLRDEEWRGVGGGGWKAKDSDTVSWRFHDVMPTNRRQMMWYSNWVVLVLKFLKRFEIHMYRWVCFWTFRKDRISFFFKLKQSKKNPMSYVIWRFELLLDFCTLKMEALRHSETSRILLRPKKPHPRGLVSSTGVSVCKATFLYTTVGVGRDSSIGIATCYCSTIRGSNPGGGEIFRTHPDRPWGGGHTAS